MSITDLEEYFKDKELPNSIEFGQGVTITNVRKFVDSHLTVLNNYGIKQSFESFYIRLIKLRDILESNT